MSLVIPPNTRAVGTPDPAGDMDNVADMLGLLTQALAGIAGKPGNTPPAGNAANVTAVQALTAGTDTGLQPSGDTTGTTDTAAINNMLGATAGTVANLGAGTFYVKSDILMQGAGQQLAGQQIKGTIIQPVAGGTFTNGIIAITADRCGVHDILFQGASGTVTSNPAATAIWINGTFHTFLEDIEGIQVNGWVVDLESTGSATNLYARHIVARQCAGGIKLSGPVSNRAIGATLDGCSTAQIGVSTGPFANLDALYCYRVTDITMTNCNFSVGNSTTGHGAHFLAVSNVYLAVFDMGGFTIPLPGSGQCGILVDGNGTDGNTSGVTFENGVLQTWDIGARVTGNCTNVEFSNINAGGNMTHGIKVDSTFGNTAFIRNCKFGVTSGGNGNGGATSYSYTATNASPAVFTATGSSFASGSTVQLTSGAPTGFSTATTYYVVSASGTTFSLSATSGGAAINSTSTGSGTLTPGPSYDLYWNSTSACRVECCEFNSAIVAVGANGVQQSVAVPAGNNTQFIYNRFTGTGTSTSNQYTNTPANVASAFFAAPAASVSYAPANPATTASTTLVMMGLGSTCTYTPTGTGKVLAVVTGQAATATAAVNVQVGARFGTGTAPVNGAAVTGTRFGSVGDPTIRGAAVSVPGGGFGFTAVLSLTPGTAYWFDLALLTTTAADVAAMTNAAMSLAELPA